MHGPTGIGATVSLTLEGGAVDTCRGNEEHVVGLATIQLPGRLLHAVAGFLRTAREKCGAAERTPFWSRQAAPPV